MGQNTLEDNKFVIIIGNNHWAKVDETMDIMGFLFFTGAYES